LSENCWIEAIVHFKNPLIWENKRKFALTFIKPTLEKLWKQKAIKFFHYFFEPELRLRLCSDGEKIDRVKSTIRSSLKSLENRMLRPVEFNSYRGEFESFLKRIGAKDAWFVGRDFFMENSGTALHFLEMLDKKTIFNPTNWMFDRFLHSFCNELGFTNIEEGKILFEYSIFRATAESRNRGTKEETKRILEELAKRLQSLRAELLKLHNCTRIGL